MPSDLSSLTAEQRELLAGWLPGAKMVRDHGWGLLESVVLEVADAGQHFIVKAGSPADAGIARELAAHHHWLTPWAARARAPQLVHGDAEAGILVTRYLPGQLVLGHPSAADPRTHRQAGELLALLHDQPQEVSTDHERRQNERTLWWLDSPHRIPLELVEQVRRCVDSWPEEAVVVVPTHGDWQPRNWLVDDGVVRVIDFGRAALRPALTDLCRLSVQDFAGDPALERAFFEGYGADPRTEAPQLWWRTQIREAVGTAAWAQSVGDPAFADQGLRLLRRALRESGRD